MSVFLKKEYEQRLFKIKASMEEHGLEIIILADPANMNYLTGYDGWSFYTPQVVVIVLDEKEPFWIGRGMDRKWSQTYLLSFRGTYHRVPGQSRADRQ